MNKATRKVLKIAGWIVAVYLALFVVHHYPKAVMVPAKALVWLAHIVINAIDNPPGF